MSHFGKSGPPDIVDTYSLLVLNVSFRTTADDLFLLFDKCGKVVDVFIPRDRRTGESRGFAFVRYKYADEAQNAVAKLDGKLVDGREIAVQFAKYGPNAERIQKGRIVEKLPSSRFRSSSRSPRQRYQDDYHRDRDYRRRSRSRSWDRYEHDRYRGRERGYHYRSRSSSASPYDRSRGRGHYDDESPEHDRVRGRVRHDTESKMSRSRSIQSPSTHRGVSPRRSLSPRNGSPDTHIRNDQSPIARKSSLQGRAADNQSPLLAFR